MSIKRMFSTLGMLKLRKAPIIITPAASNRLALIISQFQDVEKVKGVRLSIKSKGCSGLSYTMNYVHDTPDDLKKYANDEIILCENNVKLYVDIKAIIKIVGTTMDFTETDLDTEFVFINPNSKSSCGCGLSFFV